MALDEQVSSLIGKIYAPVSGNGTWAEAAVAMSDYFGAFGTTLVLCKGPQVVSLQTHGYDDRDMRDVPLEYAHDFHHINNQALFERHRPDALIYADGIDPIYNVKNYPDFARWEQQKLNAYYHLTALCRAPEELCFAFTFSGGKERGAYSKIEQDCFTLLAGHLEKSVRIAYRLGQLTAPEAMSIPTPGDAFHAFPQALAIVRPSGELVFANQAFEGFLRNVEGLSTRGRCLAFASQDTQSRFLDMLRQNIGDHDTVARRHRGLLARSKDRCKSFIVEVYPLPAVNQQGFQLGKAAMVMITTHNPGGLPDPALVKDLLGLTEAEARVAAHIGAGLSPADVAARLGLRVETVRSTLKHIYAKTGLARQNELAALVSGLMRA